MTNPSKTFLSPMSCFYFTQISACVRLRLPGVFTRQDDSLK